VAVHDAGPFPPPPGPAGPEPPGDGPPAAGERERPPAVRDRLGVVGNWRLLGTLIAGGLMVAIFLTVAVDSQAYFTAQSTSPNNAFGADQVDIRLATSGQIIVDGSNLAPGVVRTGTQTVTNYGPKAQLSLDARNLTGAGLLDTLVVTVTETSPGSGQRYSGSVRNLHNVDLGSLGAAQAKSFAVSVTWPADKPDPSLAGTSVSLDFAWTAETFR
jgi:hypothetical protein